MSRMYQPLDIEEATADRARGLHGSLRAAWLRTQTALKAVGGWTASVYGTRLSERELRRRLALEDRPTERRTVPPRSELRERDLTEIGLTSYDRQRIAEIRAELDEEFDSLPGGQPVVAQEAPKAAPQTAWLPDWSRPSLARLRLLWAAAPWTRLPGLRMSWPTVPWPRIPVVGIGAVGLVVVVVGSVAFVGPWLRSSTAPPSGVPTQLTQGTTPSGGTTEPQVAALPQASATGQTPARVETGSAVTAPAPKVEVPAEATEQEALRDAFGQWLAATKRRDIAGQMKFYPNVVPVYYARRNVPRETVRSEKTRTLGKARAVDIQAGPPVITLDRDGRSAAMRFTKKFAITGPTATRRGRVLQELRWSKIGGDWKIVGERDAKVFSRS
jgi:hypothetical protein